MLALLENLVGAFLTVCTSPILSLDEKSKQSLELDQKVKLSSPEAEQKRETLSDGWGDGEESRTPRIGMLSLTEWDWTDVPPSELILENRYFLMLER
ncbi:hypothetical protein DACRYDRAFT_103545 [Dacryopinax primogenitus]|uniref:Uncharacterized protein n=1 Tax=Dacryopinax primogenitus (strain DJM 731) TaxID=1858805 RepID=M5GD46_DACPD|nr:uncharacterized protein DACRYDRAFT_103545 [Dacryopinax primogenitus]EJU06600.1 hypothetical protein DACRYDRAFT_103545 [Dacryopinax primogenitus]